jgi:hypothetical protein
MARVKDWLIDMESYAWEAQEKGITDVNGIVKYCKKHMGNVDERYIRELFEGRTRSEVQYKPCPLSGY